MAEIELGFVERVDDPDQLSSPFFPSKVGGRPAWLDLRDLPPPQKLACGVCGKPSVFLLQLYAPIPRQPWSFHRSFFVFMCKDPSCHQHHDFRAFRVLRCQLPSENDSYQQSSSDDNIDDGTQDSGIHGSSVSGKDIDRKRAKSNDVLCGAEGAVDRFSGIAIGDTNQTLSASSEQDQPKMGSNLDAPEEAADIVESSNAAVYSSKYGQKKVCDKENKLPPSSPVTATLPFEMPSLCVVCGCLGPKRCGKCRQPQYCSREHQVHDWKNGHKLFCSDIATGNYTTSDGVQYNPGSGVLLPEFEIVTEPEPEVLEQATEERSEEERMEDYLKLLKSGKCGTVTDNDGGKSRKLGKTPEKATSDARSDKYFNAFKKRVALEPEQVEQYSNSFSFGKIIHELVYPQGFPRIFQNGSISLGDTLPT